MFQIEEKYLTFENGSVFADFELDAYAQLDVEVELDTPADLNHVWGAAPANLIPRCIVGIKPADPGFRKFSVTLHTGKLNEFYCKHPTPLGAIELK